MPLLLRSFRWFGKGDEGTSVFYLEVGANTLINTAVNETRVFEFVLPFRATISKVVSEVRVLETGKFYGVGLYDVNGNLVVRTAALSLDSIGIQESNLVTPATLEPGVYYLAQTTDATGTGALRGLTSNSATLAIMNEGAENRAGAAANDGTAGVLAATMGAVSASQATMPAEVFFKP